MVWVWPTMPNRGAAEMAIRRSRSSLRPVTSACTGAWKPTAAALAGMSWTRPSVIRKAPAAGAIHSTSVGTRGMNAMPYCMLLPQPFDQSGRVDLVGLVVAGQRVHHDVDAGTEGEFALARFARRQRQHRLAVGADRPGAGKIVRGDDERRDAVAAARRPRCRLVVILARQGLDPGLARIEAARKIAQQIKRLGQHVLARHRL